MRRNFTYKLPDKPMKEETILNRMVSVSEEAKNKYTKGGKVSGCVYTSDE